MENITDLKLSKSILAKITKLAQKLDHPVSFMHICGTHEYTISKNSLRTLLPKNVKVVAGPGCPVCVCPTGDINLAIELSQQPNVILTSFGDMMRVPSSTISLQEAKAQGADVRVVYGPHDAIELAQHYPEKEIVFFGIGFETTAPLIAYEINHGPPDNFSVISAHKLVPPAMEYLVSLKDLNLDGFILPGHVSVIIGETPYQQFLQHHPYPMVIAGFEVNDVLISIYRLLQQHLLKIAKLENTYGRVVKQEGNPTAKSLLKKIFTSEDTMWRGLGTIPNSGYILRDQYQPFDALIKFDIQVEKDAQMPPGCKCDQVLLGKISPAECPLFGTKCTPRKPVGPCMVSHEGSCKIAYQFRELL